MSYQGEFNFESEGGAQSKLEREFLRFHQDHPEVYALLCKIAREQHARGLKHLSINHCFEVARGRLPSAVGDVVGFKLNNNHRPYYSRLINRDEADIHFKIRAQREQCSFGPDNRGLPPGEHVA